MKIFGLLSVLLTHILVCSAVYFLCLLVPSTITHKIRRSTADEHDQPNSVTRSSDSLAEESDHRRLQENADNEESTGTYDVLPVNDDNSLEARDHEYDMHSEEDDYGEDYLEEDKDCLDVYDDDDNSEDSHTVRRSVDDKDDYEYVGHEGVCTTDGEEEEEAVVMRILFQDQESECPDVNSKFLKSTYVPWGTPRRAYETFPSELKMMQSTIPMAGQGVFSKTFIKKYTWLGEYEGEIVSAESAISLYAWVLTRDGVQTHNIDGLNLDTSNWMRWVNCPRNTKEENVRALDCKGRLFYITTRDIYPGQELLVYYGHEYALTIDVDPVQFDL